MKISFDHVLAYLFNGIKPGMDHTSNTLELAKMMVDARTAKDLADDPLLTMEAGMSLDGLIKIQKNRDIGLMRISNNLPKQ